MRAQLSEMGVVLLILALAGFGVDASAQLTQAPAGVLTNAAQVRSLKAAQAARAIPVRLRGVVIDESAPREYAVILADDTAGIYLLAATNLFRLYHQNDLLEIQGVTDPGQFAPIVKVSTARKIGIAPIPAPRRVSYQELITGALDGQWVEISGVVHRCMEMAKTQDMWRIYIAANGGVLTVRGSVPRDPQIEEDAEVRVQAVCLYQFNHKRQVLTPVLQVPPGVSVRVDKPAPTNPFDAPLRSADSLLQFAPDNPIGHRVHVHGTVTYAQSGSIVWIRDETSGLRIQARQEEKLKPGDEIDVLGFPVYGSFSPMLEDALFRKNGVGQPPTPRLITNATNAFEYEDDLISAEAAITDVQPVFEGMVLTLKSGGTDFKAFLKKSPDYKSIPDWQPGSKVRIAGICSVIHDDVRPLMGIWKPQVFQVLMRSPADLQIISRPPWWTPQHLILFMVVVIGGLLLVTGVVMLLSRRRLKEQYHQRAMAEAEFAAILSERNRMAREIHDTLAQGLVATSVQLRLASKQSAGASEAFRQHLDSAQQLVRESLQEARNSIWNMRSQVLENGDLAGAMKGILKQMADGTEVETHFEVAGKAHRLAPLTESNVLRVGQEAITNAIRHAQARHIRLKLEFGEKQFRLIVSDDGSGFDPDNPLPVNGGFGLVGMRERAAELKGNLNFRSAPGQGSEISLSVPISGG
jgi:signal transduction histidine kinase